MTNDWFVITGAPSSGKSSVLRELVTRGYRVAPESARVILDQEISKGRSPEDIRASDGFQEQVESLDKKLTSIMPDDEFMFFDRSIADNIIYRKHMDNIDVDRMSQDSSLFDQKFKKHVFLMERLPVVNDGVRTEDEEEAEKVQEITRYVYDSLGCEIHEISCDTVSNRADEIENIALEKVA